MIGVQAQNPGDDMTSYITNPNFTGNADGWTITGSARYFNAAGFDGTLSFIELTNWGSSWDATVSQTVTVPNGYYKVKAAGQMSGTADCWMKLVANGAESRFSRNGATDGNILANGTETTIGNGVAGWRYTSVIAHVTNGSLEISCVGHSNVKERWANFDAVTLTFLGTEIPANTDVTDYISNWDFWGCFNDEFNGWTIEKTGGNSWVHGNTAVEHWSNDLTRTFDYYQEISGLPEGRYTISASMWNTQGSGPNGNSGVYGTSNGVTAFAGVTDDCGDTDLHTYSTSIFVNNGDLRLGVKNNGTRSAFWFGVDWIKLQYVGKVVQDYAVALPAGGAMTADTWYYFDINAAADNYYAAATTLGDIICTDDGNTLISAATGNVTLTATDNSFAAKRYYVKSSSANNLEIGVASYSYSVSSATADKAYIQPGQTVTVSYVVSTNDPGATLTQDYSGVTFNGSSIAVTPTASGFTFTVPAVVAGSALTLAIPANAIGYAAGSTYNADQNITLNVPAVFDGIYFLKAAATYDGSSEGTSAAVGKYLARGMNFGTHATLDKYGLPLQITTDANNATSIQAYDTKRYFFHGNTYDCWADQASLAASGYFTITQNNGKLLIHNNTMAAGTYLKYNTTAASDANIAVFDDGNGTNAGPIIMWTTETVSEHATVMQNYKDGQATDAAAAAYASGNYESLGGITTVSALETELEANYIKGDFVSPSTIESIQEKYQGGQPGSGNITEKVYSNTIDITEPGFYKFSMQAFYRAGSNDVTQDMHTNGVDFPPVVLYFGDSETQIKSIYDEGGLDQGIAEGYFETETVGGAPVQYNGKWYTNGQHNSVIIFQKDYYHNDVYFYASEPGTYEYGVKYMGWACANAQWFIYSPESVEITSYAAAADAADYTALQNAIDAYDAATWGFETGEYAPYNNATAIEKIADAKAINPAEDNSKLLVNSLTAYLTLTANATEVNAFSNNGYFQSNINAIGWKNTNWIQQEGNYLCVPSGSSVTYGETAAYTMPLKADTYYVLTFRHASWDTSNKDNGGSVSVLLNEDGLAATAYTGNPDYYKGDDANYKKESFVFQTGAAGNYVLTLTGGSGRTTVKDFVLKEAESATMQVSGTAKMGTFCAPFDVAIPEGVTAYEASISSDKWVHLEEIESGVIDAGTPVILSITADDTFSQTFYGVNTAEDPDNSGVLKGLYKAETKISGEYPYYIMQYYDSKTAFFRVPTGQSRNLGANRCYLQPESNLTPARIAIGGEDDDFTAIDELKAIEAEAKTMKDGKYLVKGRIVIVKNGKAFGANGQKLK